MAPDFRLKQYWPLLCLVVGLLIILFCLIPPNYTYNADSYRIRATFGAFIFGGLVGVSEIASRYRDEPLKALRSPFGLIYIILNGYLSILALFLIYHFASSYFQSVASDSLMAAIVAGFGASVVMRTRIAVIKGPDGKDVSIGPDFVISIALQVIDTNIDRWRAVRRQHILGINFDKIRKLGDFPSAWKYLLASLLAFQNLDDARKKTLNDTFNDYQAQGEKLPEDIKRLGLGFLFLTLVGESNFSSVLDSATNVRTGAPGQGSTPDSASSSPPAPKTPTPFIPASEPLSKTAATPASKPAPAPASITPPPLAPPTAATPKPPVAAPPKAQPSPVQPPAQSSALEQGETKKPEAAQPSTSQPSGGPTTPAPQPPTPSGSDSSTASKPSPGASDTTSDTGAPPTKPKGSEP